MLPVASPAAEDVPRVRRALVMAGGRGSRLLPLTENCPKPLLPVRGEPMLFRILQRLAAVGVEEAWISILYLGDQIRAAVGDGSRFGLRVEYLEEREPLGTAGALGLLRPRASPLFVSTATSGPTPTWPAWRRGTGGTATP
jgi:NDP-sugar pyrophosphorylase family protein